MQHALPQHRVCIRRRLQLLMVSSCCRGTSFDEAEQFCDTERKGQVLQCRLVRRWKRSLGCRD